MTTKQQGFTLIELMIVIAILAILLAIAVPAYQNYAVRAKASECISIAASPKLAVAETYQSEAGTWPADFAAAGYAPEASQYCQAATYGGTGVFSVQTQNIGAADITFKFTPSEGTTGARIDWTCEADGATNPAHVPAECRGGGEEPE